MKFPDPKLIEEALKELQPLEQLLYCDALLCSRIINGTEDDEKVDDEVADYIRELMDWSWKNLSKEERERLDKFMYKAGNGRLTCISK